MNTLKQLKQIIKTTITEYLNENIKDTQVSSTNDIVSKYIKETEYDILRSKGNCTFFTKDFIDWCNKNNINCDYVFMPQDEGYRKENKITDERWENHIVPMVNNKIIDFTYTSGGVSRFIRTSNTIPPEIFEYNEDLFKPDGAYGKYGYREPEVNTTYGKNKNINTFGTENPDKKSQLKYRP